MIKFHLYKFEKEVQFQIIEQSGVMKKLIDNSNPIIIHKGRYMFYFSINSTQQLDMDIKYGWAKEVELIGTDTRPISDIRYNFAVFLRGEYWGTGSYSISSLKFESNKKRDEYCYHLLLAFKDFRKELDERLLRKEDFFV